MNSSGAGPVNQAKVVDNEKDPSSSKQVCNMPVCGSYVKWQAEAICFENAILFSSNLISILSKLA